MKRRKKLRWNRNGNPDGSMPGSLIQKKKRNADRPKVLMVASVASMIDQFNLPNIRLLQKMGYEVHIACNFREGNTCDAAQLRNLQKILSDMRVVYYQWNCPRDIRSIGKCVYAYMQLEQILVKNSFAWIHCHSPIGGLLARIAAHGKHIRVIYTAHGFHFYKGAPLKNWLLYYPAEKWLAHWTQVLITVNREDYHFAKKYLNAGTVCYIPGVGIDIKKYAKKQYAANAKEKMFPKNSQNNFRKRFHIPQDAAVLLSVGELSRRKNHKIVLSALADMPEKNVYYLICGQGPLEQKLMRQAKKLGIADRIRMPGFLADMAPVYHNADIFVFPSIQEGMPAALMEAMASGLPCVVSDIRGNRELIDGHRGGRLCSLTSVDQFRESISDLLENRWMRFAYGTYNREKIAGYDLGIVKKKMQSIYAGMKPVRKEMQCMETETEHLQKRISDIPYISVLIAVYNPDINWLEQLLESVNRQSFQDFEVLLIDDCSDGVLFSQIQKAAEKCLDHNRRVSLYRNRQNEGSNRTFEKLVRMAKGIYVAFCDQDDIWEENKLEELTEAVKRESAVMAYSDMSVIDENGRMHCKSLRKMRKWLHYVQGNGLTAYYLADNCTAGCSMMARTDLVKKALPFYGQVYCDQWIAACVSAYGKVVFVDKPLVRYRRHHRNQTYTLQHIRNKRDYFEKRIIPMYGCVQEMKKRGIHFADEKAIQAFAAARKNSSVRLIWKYRKFNKKYAYFDMLVICMPDLFVETVLDIFRKQQVD